MYLSKLEIIGFKSFAQRVNLTFDSGISAIVGPNGCGKTNIVDAIRWVLGEQRYSALRSEKMEDVIFNGTKLRKPLGMSEVSLVIENTRGVLPSEYAQVTIGRRVYRSGESEYLLNKVPCRLKDILDLFMDTGMGADAYSVIELKMVETILSDKTDERRHLFEEAAGVTKYKHRRKAAYRKLEAVRADLLRVNDIVTEVQKAVSALERQARKAQQYNSVRDRLRAKEIDLMEREYALYIARSVPLQTKLSDMREARAGVDAELTQKEALLESLRGRMLETERRLGEARSAVGDQREAIHRIEEKNLVAGERNRSLRLNIGRLEKEVVEFEAEQARLEEVRVALRTTIDERSLREMEARKELELRRAELADAEARLDGRKAELQRVNEQLLALVHEISEGQRSLDRHRGRVEHLAGQLERARQENAAYESDIVRLEADISSLTDEDRQLRRQNAEAEMRLYEAEEQKKSLLEEVERLRRDEMERKSEIERRRARMEFLRSVLESRENLPEGVRFLSTAAGWKAGAVRTVADSVHAEPAYVPAIEAALGDYASCLLVDTGQEAEAGFTLLRQEGKGKATMICLDRLPAIRTVHRLPALEGVLGWAADIARFESGVEPVFRLLLDRVLIVESLEAARRAMDALAGVRCVTLAGEIVTGIGVTRGGGRRDEEGGIIGKQQQLEEYEREVVRLESALAGVAESREALVRRHDAIEVKVLAEKVKAIEREMNSVEVRIAQVAFEKKRAMDVIAKNSEEMAQLSAETAQLQTLIEEEAPRLDTLRLGQGEIERASGALGNEIQALEREWNERSRVVQDLEIGMVTLQTEVQSALEDLRRTEDSIVDVGSSVATHRAEISQSSADISAAEETTGTNTRILEELQAELGALEAQRSEIEKVAIRDREDAHQVELRIKDLRRTAEEELLVVHDCELKVQDLAAKADHIRARAQEEFEYAIELKSYPEDEFVDFAALRDEILHLRERAKSLGNINFAAFEEYSSEKQRLEFLTAQRADLVEAERTLLATIEEINATAQRKFLETFGQIRTNFVEIFKSLFDPGDEADLRLEEEVDPLEARIEIIAKPRGKRPTSIDLLSGGEKTLTATALLFAIYLVKPSPFCILDEVDAPLDDANIDRFTRILRKFSHSTQFIVVTHNKRTMEAANALYGVTMEEEGVSKIVTVRFNQASQLASAALATA